MDKKLLWTLCFLWVGIIYSQDDEITVNYNNVPLKTVLTDLEQKTEIIFSFSEEVIEAKFIDLTLKAPITDILKRLELLTGLVFEKISDQQVIISFPSNKITVCGYLFDADLKDPLPFANIVIEGTSKGAISDEKGYFQIEKVAATAALLIQYVGYENIFINASDYSNENCRNIYIRPDTQSLNEVVVLGYITKGVDRNTDGSITVTNDNVGIFPGISEPDLFQSIQLIPGITSPDESASGIQIRGGSPDQNLILWDGIRIYNTGHFFGLISAFNPYITEDAKIYKGGASARYGDRISGVIDLKSDTKIPRRFEGGFGLNGTHADLFFKVPFFKSVGLVLSARHSYTNILETPTFESFSEKAFQNTRILNTQNGEIIPNQDDDTEIIENQANNEFFFSDVNAKLIVKPSKNDLITFSGLRTNNELDFRVQDDEDVSRDDLIIKNEGASFEWSGSKGRKFHHHLNGYYSNFDSDYNFQILEDNILEEEDIRRNIVEDYGFGLNLGYDFLPQHRITAGYQFSKTDVSFLLFRDDARDGIDIDPDEIDDDIPPPVLSANTRDFNITRRNEVIANTAFAEYQYKLKNNGLINLGLRTSHYSDFDDLFFEPRANIEIPITNSIRLKATGEKRYQVISQLVEFEDVQLRLENNIWTVSNGEDIPILESTQFSGGFLINSKGWTFDIDGYYKNISGLTSFTNGFTNTNNEISEGESRVVGVDILLKKKIGNFRLWLGYTFNDIEFTFSELQSSPFPGNNDITHNFNISNTYEVKNWEFSLGWNYRTGAPFTDAEGFNTTNGDINFGSINAERFPDYHRLDASATYKFNISKNGNWRGRLGVSLLNIYNRQVPLSVFYRVDENPVTQEQELEQLEQLSLGITPNIVFRIYF
ncbi:TonB-dependent receptor plug domain-containing protein [Flavobacteriaceae bacterium R38]|nr:TonB-dependent receptor plug domain-containing protein [Flavobacteriaceae bacterium R38]